MDHVPLVSDEHHGRRCRRAGVAAPLTDVRVQPLDVAEALAVGDGVHQQEAVSPVQRLGRRQLARSLGIARLLGGESPGMIAEYALCVVCVMMR